MIIEYWNWSNFIIFLEYFENGNKEGNLINDQYNLLFPIITGYFYNTKPSSMTFMTRLLSARYLDDKAISPDIDTQLVKVSTRSTSLNSRKESKMRTFLTRFFSFFFFSSWWLIRNGHIQSQKLWNATKENDSSTSLIIDLIFRRSWMKLITRDT